MDHNQNQNQLTYGADAVAPVSNLPASLLLLQMETHLWDVMANKPVPQAS